MRYELKKKIADVCAKKILLKGESVGVSFYAFFANRNDDPELLMEAATWWIEKHQLEHFEALSHVLYVPCWIMRRSRV